MSQSRKQFERRLQTLISETSNEFQRECLILYDSKVINADEFPDDFLLPRIMLRIAMERKAPMIIADRTLKFNDMVSVFAKAKEKSHELW